MKKRKQTELSHPNFVAVRLSDTEITILDQACASLGTTRSEYLRRLLTEKKIYNNVEIVADIKLLRVLVGQYGKIGSNLNQILIPVELIPRLWKMKSINVSLISSDYENRFWKWQVIFMAILKHIKSRNANYSDAIDYLLFQHDESTEKKIKDEMGR